MRVVDRTAVAVGRTVEAALALNKTMATDNVLLPKRLLYIKEICAVHHYQAEKYPD
jgi:hypothetical protein